MEKSIWCSKPVALQKKEQQDNSEYPINEIRNALLQADLEYEEERFQNFEELIKYLKIERYPNIIQGKGESLSEAKSCWNNLYFIALVSR